MIKCLARKRRNAAVVCRCIYIDVGDGGHNVIQRYTYTMVYVYMSACLNESISNTCQEQTARQVIESRGFKVKASNVVLMMIVVVVVVVAMVIYNDQKP